MKANRTISIKPPVLPAKETSVNSIDIQLVDDCEYENFALSQFDLSNQEARFVVLDCARLTQVRLNSCMLTKLQLSDVLFDRCDLSNAEWLESKINRIEILDCKLTGFKAIDGDASNCKFQNCVGDVVQMHGSKFKSTIFQNCQFRRIDFRFCDLQGATFIDCDLREAQFYDAKLNGADFRGSDLTGMNARPEDLKGAIINSQQASELGRHFASLLGLEIKDS